MAGSCVLASGEAQLPFNVHFVIPRNPRWEKRATCLPSRLHGTWVSVLSLLAPALPDVLKHLGISQVESVRPQSSLSVPV